MNVITAEVDYKMAGLSCVVLTGDHVDEIPDEAIGEALTNARAGMLSASFQERAADWLEACFGESNDPLRKTRRAQRFCEESLELVQALGISKGDVLQLVDYVYGRDVGEPKQEVGGVMLTLAGVCVSNEFDLVSCSENELARVWTKVDAIRAKNARQVAGSPLPGADDKSARIDVA